MLDNAFMEEFLKKLHAIHNSPRGEEASKDVLELMKEFCRPLPPSDAETKEIAQTILEILEPERIGRLILGSERGEWPDENDPDSICWM